jgi:hypothetical protein
MDNCGASREHVAKQLEAQVERLERRLKGLRQLHLMAVQMAIGSPEEDALNTLVWNQRGEGIGF